MYRIKTVAAVIPIYYPNPVFFKALESLYQQTYRLSRVIIIDSTPDTPDKKEQVYKWMGCIHGINDIPLVYITILEREFDHGGTRNYGVKLAGEVDAVLFLTQDAVMNNDCLKRMVEYLNKLELAATFARQIPRPKAGKLEKLERQKYYPPVSRVIEGIPCTLDDIFFSNTCSLIRKEAWQVCMGFPEGIITAEDMILASRLLNKGYRIGYCAEAMVTHSHAIEFIKTLRRYFDTGAMHSEWRRYIPVNTAAKKGMALVVYQFRNILRYNPLLLFVLSMNILGKYIGYKLGIHYQILPNSMRIWLSQNRNYWSKLSKITSNSNLFDG